MALKFGVAFGCEVHVISRNRAKEADALRLGAKSLIPTDDEAAVKAAANSLDAIIDTVAAKHALEPLFGMLVPRGKICIVGAPPADASFAWMPFLFKCVRAGDRGWGRLGFEGWVGRQRSRRGGHRRGFSTLPDPLPSHPLSPPAQQNHQRSLTLCSSLVGTRAHTQEMLDFCAAKGIVSDVEVVTADYANEAFKRMEKGDVRFRFVIDVNKSA